MSQFYARYVPPAPSSITLVAESSSSRKRPVTTEQGPSSTKRRKVHQQNGEAADVKTDSKEASQSSERKHPQTEKNSLRKGERVRVKNVEQEESAILTRDVISFDSNRGTTVQDDEPTRSKHMKVLSRFGQAKEKSAQVPIRERDTLLQPAVVLHDLEPIPQPSSDPTANAIPIYATGPEWLRRPVRVDSSLSKSFVDMGLSKNILENLQAQGKSSALPVQSAVLPLLLSRSLHQRPDLCVAAATGSGKTFAYVLPILNDLSSRVNVQLRAVIVVPTRALVKQVVQVLESCSAGLNIKIGAAEGSKTLAEEQKQLVQESSIFAMDEWKRQRDTPVDWSAFSVEDVIKDAKEHESLANIGRVTRYQSNIDILVCTPGRLIEHIEVTKGFNLCDVEWFVADEADRLLNESYHAWLDVVLPALTSPNATKTRDDFLRSMYIDVPPRRVTKLLLSATMTNDISHLLAMQLTNPQLVIGVEGTINVPDQAEIGDVSNDRSDFQLPPALRESAITLKDSENKPLYLAELLTSRILASNSSSILRKHIKTINGSHDSAADDTSSSGSSDSSDSTDSDSDVSSTSSDSDSELSNASTSQSGGSVSSPSSSSSSSSSPLVSSQHKIEAEQSNGVVGNLLKQPRALIFTRSAESAHRLSRLLVLLLPDLASKIATYTRASSSAKSASTHQAKPQTLQSFATGKTPILVCTDLAARGLDIADLEHVINYDIPTSAMTYVHRVGRTARAGKEGDAWTLVEHKQGKWFWETIGGKMKPGRGQEKNIVGRGDRSVQKINIVVDMDRWADKYETALHKLGEDVKRQ